MNEYLEIISKQAQRYYKSSPTIILGSGASAAFSMSGMYALGNHLKCNVQISDLSIAEQNSWVNFVKELDAGVDLESALHNVPLSIELTRRVKIATWNLLNPEDYKVFTDSLTKRNHFPLGKMLQHMFRSTIHEINIITTNYDRLAEYACEQENIHHYTGFSHGYKGHSVAKHYLKCDRQVNIWKVHGSLGWFQDKSGTNISLGNSTSIPEDLTPLIITPGIEKYRNTHKEPYKTIIHESDNVIDNSNTYLCIGFGFNDEHIQEKLINRCAKGDASVIVITYKLSDSAKKFLLDGHASEYLAIEYSTDHSSKIYSSEIVGEVEIDGSYWSIKDFCNLIM